MHTKTAKPNESCCFYYIFHRGRNEGLSRPETAAELNPRPATVGIRTYSAADKPACSLRASDRHYG